MLARSLVQQRVAASAVLRPAARTLSSTTRILKSPALADVLPDNAHVFDQRQQQFREELTARVRREREQRESQSASASTEAKHPSSPSSSTATALGDQGLGSLATGEKQSATEQKKVGSGPLSKLIYGTEEGRKMDQDIERSFSQVLARGKYVHSIVFHEVKPDKVDEYVELVGSWYPRMAGMPENKVCLCFEI